MKQKLLIFSLVLLFSKALAQPITVNTNQFTVPQLVQDVLFGNGTAGSSCVGTISNITWSTGTNFGASTKTIFSIKNDGNIAEVINPVNKNQRLLVKKVSLRSKK